jgi:transcriptional regulator with XRE-family HTH domain
MAQGSAKKTIRQLREERGWTQIELAARLGLHHSAVSKWERGVTLPAPDALLRLADLFSVSVAELVAAQTEQGPHSAPPSRQSAPGDEEAPGP